MLVWNSVSMYILLILQLLLINDRCDYLNVRLKGERITTFRVSQKHLV